MYIRRPLTSRPQRRRLLRCRLPGNGLLPEAPALRLGGRAGVKLCALGLYMVYADVHIDIDINIDRCIDININIDIAMETEVGYRYLDIDIDTDTSICICICIYIYIRHTYMHVHMYLYISVHVYIVYNYIHMYTLTYMYKWVGGPCSVCGVDACGIVSTLDPHPKSRVALTMQICLRAS